MVTAASRTLLRLRLSWRYDSFFLVATYSFHRLYANSVLGPGELAGCSEIGV